MHKLLVGQSGGPTAAINATLAGVMSAAKARGLELLGMRFGIEGYLAGKSVDLTHALEVPADSALLRATPASWLGSCRFKLPDPTSDATADKNFYEHTFARFAQDGVDGVLYLGGNDSMDTIAKLSRWGEAHGSPVRFVGVPKTIDNDLMGTDHTPGFGSAAKFVATSVSELALDANVYDLKGVLVVEIMGRDSGWLTASAAAAAGAGSAGADLILLPEVALDLDALIGRVNELLEGQNTVVIALSEGVRDASGTLLAEKSAETGTARDQFGHLAAYSGAGRWLAATLKARLGVKSRAVELSTLQRCASHVASGRDLDESFALGQRGVQAACVGESGVMCAIERLSSDPYSFDFGLVDVNQVANQVKCVPRAWISADGMGVTPDVVSYVAPLISGEAPVFYTAGVPAHVPPVERLEHSDGSHLR